jgi:hypothetical protein
VGPTCRRAEEKGRIPLRVLIPGWAVGWFLRWAKRVPGVLFPFLFCLLLFFFCFSYFLYNFCINSSNNVNPISNLF